MSTLRFTLDIVAQKGGDSVPFATNVKFATEISRRSGIPDRWQLRAGLEKI
ncbi:MULTISPECIES: hypothetical protein [unclassified Phaeobacter]|uniref:hypothetical protein n=1 Tax=unclassified Phaeobacter TaxID=2621772 RepID=UPI003A8A787F